MAVRVLSRSRFGVSTTIGIRAGGGDSLYESTATQRRQVEIEDHRRRRLCNRQTDDLTAVIGIGDHLDTRCLFEQTAQDRPH